MPERQIPWRQVAKRLKGNLEVTTGIAGSRMQLTAQVDGIAVEVDATSAPYASSGGRTEVRAISKHSFGARLYLLRNVGTVPLYRRFLLRDVILGEPLFDAAWIINAKREAHAQAFLDKEMRELIDAVPLTHTPANYISELRNVFYEFSLRGREVQAFTDNFETDPDRLGAAISAAVALANQPQKLLARWRSLAAELDGKFEHAGRFRMDGSTRIRFPLQGRPVVVSPRMVKLSWRRDRLRTHISCEAASNRSKTDYRWSEGEDAAELGEHAELVKGAVEAAGAILLRSNRELVEVQLDGNVTDKTRIIAAASLVALLSQGDEGVAGPYR